MASEIEGKTKAGGELDETVLKGLNEILGFVRKGDLSHRLRTEGLTGLQKEIVLQVNGILDAVESPLKEVVSVLNKMSVNDFETRVSDRFEGTFGVMSRTLNTLIDQFKDVSELVSNVAQGDLKDAPRLRALGNGTGKLSANDKLLPSMIRLMDRLELLVEDTGMMARAAADGRLDVRADATKHSGFFRTLVEGINQTMDWVTGPVNETIAVLSALGQGDLSVRVLGDFKGDHAKTKEALNKALEEINDVLVQMSDSAQQLESAAAQVSAGAQAVSQAATEQASAIEEISSSLEEMQSMARKNAENANQARALADTAVQNARDGVEAMARMNKAIDDIKRSSDETSKIVKTIDDIAFQTNLLALNAAVEAARAGEAGRGFAVVAEEVRNLALRSAEAAKNTSRMIEESVKNADNGVKVAETVTKALQVIADGAKKINDILAEVYAASEEQSKGVTQISVAVEQLNKATQQNASAAEESASASEELSSQATQMQELVGRFKLMRKAGGKDDVSQLLASLDPELLKELIARAGKGAAPKQPVAVKQQKAASTGKRAHLIPLNESEEKQLREF